MPFATTSDDCKLYYEEIGAGEPLLLISGQGSDHTAWAGLRDRFADRYRVIVFDHRGTGRSDKPTEPPYSTQGFAQDVISILDHLNIPRAHCFGVSMGGRICQWLGITYPERVGSLVLGCTTPGNAHGIARSAEMNALFLMRASDPERATWAMLETAFTPAYVAANRAALAQYIALAPVLPPYVASMHYTASENHDAWDLLPAIKAPTLVIHGSDDTVNPTANAQLLADRIPGAELYIVAGGRHAFFTEFQEETARVVRDFLGRHPL